MKNLKKFVFIATVLTVLMIFTACGGQRPDDNGSYMGDMAPGGLVKPTVDQGGSDGAYVYDSVREVDFQYVADNPDSYFSLDKNTATYSYVRRQVLEMNGAIAQDSIRIEEMINYFDYDFPMPEEGESMKLSYQMADCPWNDENVLLAVGLRTKEIEVASVKNNLVFLIDVSGSMSGSDRIGLIKGALVAMAETLTENDKISIVTYADRVKTVLDGVAGSEVDEIISAVNDLSASGSTAGGKGLSQAYEIAEKNFIEDGNNRVILVSDGDFNVGPSDPEELKDMIKEKAASGTYLTVLGVGMTNTRDDVLETLASNGNGNYAYLDSLKEAKKVLMEDISGTFITLARNAKACVSFTDRVLKYRLIGYDTKTISADEFNDAEADTGEIGAGLCVTALYELTLNEGAEGENGSEIEGKTAEETGNEAKAMTLGKAIIRYDDVSEPNNAHSEELEMEIDVSALEADPSPDMIFISCVAEAGLLIRGSKYKGQADLDAVYERLTGQVMEEYLSKDPSKEEFRDLVALALDNIDFWNNVQDEWESEHR